MVFAEVSVRWEQPVTASRPQAVSTEVRTRVDGFGMCIGLFPFASAGACESRGKGYGDYGTGGLGVGP